MQAIRFLDKYATFLVMALGTILYLVHMHSSNMAGYSPLIINGQTIVWFIDSPSHLDYIARVANTLSLPKPGDCWECHQPPLYYILAAYPFSMAETSHFVTPESAVRLFSLLFYLGFVWFGAKLLAMEVPARLPYYTGLCLLVFWPYGVTKATMISNDIPLYMAQAGALYYILRWQREAKPSSLGLALLWNGVAIAFKYNGLLVTPLLIYIIFYACYKNRGLVRQCFSPPVLACASAALFLVGITFARTYYYYRIAYHSPLPLISPSLDLLIRIMGVPNDRLEYFIMPNLYWYSVSPFIQPGIYHVELRYFINFLLKSSLFGMAAWAPVKTGFAVTMLAVFMLTYLSASMVRMTIRKSMDNIMWQLLGLIALQVAALLCYRLIYPHFGNQDFRFIYITLPAMTLLYTKTLAWHRHESPPYIFWLGIVPAVAFCGLSVSFILLNASTAPY